MNKKQWCFVIVTAQTASRVRQIHISTIILILIALISCAGFIGMARLLWYTGSYASAKFGVYEAQRENRALMMKVKFLDKFITKENEKIESLVAFEDNMRLQYGMERISPDVRRPVSVDDPPPRS
jgi:hypothetical protein